MRTYICISIFYWKNCNLCLRSPLGDVNKVLLHNIIITFFFNLIAINIFDHHLSISRG